MRSADLPLPPISQSTFRNSPFSSSSSLCALFEVGNPDWRPLSWAHALCVVGLTLLFIWRIGGKAWLRHFAFPVAFILVAVPWITPIETPIVQGLMRIVAAIATETLALFGLPAQLEGSVIRISSGVVGVNEACSGVRSLQTSLMIGLLIGEMKRLGVLRRIVLIAAAAAIAFLANCARAFALVWIASERGVAAIEQWHDIAGYAIVGLVFVGTISLGAALGSKQKAAGESPANNQTSNLKLQTSAFRLPQSAIVLSLLWLLAVEGAVEAWYRVHERSLIANPSWSVHWPEDRPGFREVPIDDNVKNMLRYDDGRQAAWPFVLDGNATADPTARPDGNATMFFFRWEPGATNILRARAHRPDICLPNIGWQMAQDNGVRHYPVGSGETLPFRHFTFTRAAEGHPTLTAHAFFCQREDRVPARVEEQFDFTSSAAGSWTRSDRLRVVTDGLRNQGQQVLEIVLATARPLDAAEAQAEFAKLVPQIVDVGR